MRKILPVVLVPIGLTLGLLAGGFLAPAELESEVEDQANTDIQKLNEESGEIIKTDSYEQSPPKAPKNSEEGPSDYVKIDKQFIVPVVQGERVAALMVVSIALETAEGVREAVFSHEPKIRDEFLRTLFAHSQSGGFSGSFTDARVMEDLRDTLRAAARAIVGEDVRHVLITEIIRQDL